MLNVSTALMRRFQLQKYEENDASKAIEAFCNFKINLLRSKFRILKAIFY